ncbi:isocitrate lyase/PEP mutase family protein [Jannaschia aquimarina]|uniref:2,3-dimethylmalate lyase n=1 Tax=Jannaschia aquimarina TaxID=935700 RepID=A0A0D1EBT6_9RHOB|nr:isocitrate lyase/phosphoenolpyruvate mutase family protein [Jannaschia aquimarina]KIT15199.1 2,3-dimethylmalate lyase [Jannaschia aquimarina]SNT33017.1 2-Methylisocitrate lyase, PEP mutase family [Jannaschia aquimarina]
MTFLEMHRPGAPFVLANAWDIGSARMLTAMGAQAIATTSAGFAFTRGVGDGGKVGRDEAVAHGAELARAVNVPVLADLEDGYGPEPADAAETVAAAARAGLAGCSIEDVDGTGAPYGRVASVARIEAAVAVRPEGFVLCARADGVMHGAYDLDEAIARLQAMREAGADVLYAPVPGSADDLARLVREVGGRVNALAVGPLAQLSLADFAEIGVARVSLGSALSRVTHRAILEAGGAMLAGDFTAKGASGAEIDALLAKGTP